MEQKNTRTTKKFGSHKPRPGGFGGKRNRPFKKRVCKFCAEGIEIDYKNVWLLKNYVSPKGKMLSSRFTGVCIKHQRLLTTAIKRARNIAILPFASL
ncbi:MAG: 30S ribosomal protein S18 [Elusimicrobia bacterium ADurb.Bin231]|nr:MAG: 30S ribosomal protein S18 [Elusimicrobia bacterium ADurb.Bin231]